MKIEMLLPPASVLINFISKYRATYDICMSLQFFIHVNSIRIFVRLMDFKFALFSSI